MAYEKYPWHARNAEKLRQTARDYRASLTPKQKSDRAKNEKKYRLINKGRYRLLEFVKEMKKYGTTIEWFRDKLIVQNGLCAICDHLSRRFENLQRLQVDHDHSCCDLKTKSCGSCLRGLLCADCNVRLSYLEAVLKESTIVPKKGTWTARAIAYLKPYEPKPWNFTDEARMWLNLTIAQPGAGIRITNVQVPSYE